MELWQVLVLSIVEGLTEFVPVSSTGHLILMSRVLGLRGPAIDAFSVVVQLGALLAAVFYYRRILIDTLTGVLRRQPESLALVRNILLGSLPLLGVAYLAGKRIKAVLFAPLPVAIALGVGGLLMLMVERYRRRSVPPYQHAHELPPGRALTVGLCHLAALWPGTSRSLASMTGGLIAGLPTAAAADFAFLLALPTLGAATLYELVKERHILHSEVGFVNIGIGLLVSFVVGWLVIAAFLRYLRGHGLLAFALYRIVLALTVLGLTMGGAASDSVVPRQTIPSTVSTGSATNHTP